jgi:hypothetical protein
MPSKNPCLLCLKDTTNQIRVKNCGCLLNLHKKCSRKCITAGFQCLYCRTKTKRPIIPESTNMYLFLFGYALILLFTTSLTVFINTPLLCATIITILLALLTFMHFFLQPKYQIYKVYLILIIKIIILRLFYIYHPFEIVVIFKAAFSTLILSLCSIGLFSILNQ